VVLDLVPVESFLGIVLQSQVQELQALNRKVNTLGETPATFSNVLSQLVDTAGIKNKVASEELKVYNT